MGVMAAPEYKLTHFNTRFLAEPIRFIFAYAKVPFDEDRISVTQWEDMKKTVPWKQLPMLELADGRKIGQSSTISAYLAGKFDLTGNDEWDATRCAEISDAFRDLRQDWRKFFFQKNKERRAEFKKQFMEVTIPKYFGMLSKRQEATGGPYLVCDRVTWADLLLAHTVGFLEDTVDPGVMQDYLNLKALQIMIFETPQIKEYLQKRPKPDTSMLFVLPISM